MWIDLPLGIRFFVRAVTDDVYEKAKACGIRLAREICEQPTGGPGAYCSDITGLAELLWAQALARSTIVRWEGVAARHGGPAPVTKKNVDSVMMFKGVADAFLKKCDPGCATPCAANVAAIAAG